MSDYYGKAERMELTAQFIVAACIQKNGTHQDPNAMMKYAWDLAEIFQRERDERVAKFKNADRQ